MKQKTASRVPLYIFPLHTSTALQGDTEQENYVKIHNSKPSIAPVQWILKGIHDPKFMGLSKVSPTAYKR